MPKPNQIEKQCRIIMHGGMTCCQVPEGRFTEAGVRQNVAVGLGYVEAWLVGSGVPSGST